MWFEFLWGWLLWFRGAGGGVCSHTVLFRLNLQVMWAIVLRHTGKVFLQESLYKGSRQATQS